MEIDGKAPIEPVVFRKWRSQPKTVIALFPAVEGDNRGQVMCYEHVGQHGGADWGIVTSGLTALATPEEYADLKQELESIGYKLKVYKRWTRR